MMVKLWDLTLWLNSAVDPMETSRWPSVKMVEPSSKVRRLVPEAAMLLIMMEF